MRLSRGECGRCYAFKRVWQRMDVWVACGMIGLGGYMLSSGALTSVPARTILDELSGKTFVQARGAP